MVIFLSLFLPLRISHFQDYKFFEAVTTMFTLFYAYLFTVKHTANNGGTEVSRRDFLFLGS